MKKFCMVAISNLSFTRGKRWAEKYVELRMEFHRKHGHGLILSTWHGVEFFDNVLKALNGDMCKEPKGEYRNNFLKLIEIGSREA